MREYSSYDYENIYKDMGIDIKKLYAVMLDVHSKEKLIDLPEPYLYYDPTLPWVKGYVARDIGMHLSILYGILDMVLPKHVRTVLTPILKKGKEISIGDLSFEKIDYFTTPQKNYYCVVGKIKITEMILYTHDACNLLPHINTFMGYKPHVTLAYVQKNRRILNNVVNLLHPLRNMKLVPDRVTFDNNSQSPITIF